MNNISDNVNLLQKQEAEFAKLHRNDTDEELIAHLMKCSKVLGRCQKRGYYRTYLSEKNWSWPRILERAGLKEKAKSELKKNKK